MGKKKAARSASVQIAIGSASDLVCMLALTAVMAALTLGGAIGQGSIRTAALCANALAAFLGSLLAAKGFSQRRLPMTLLSVGGYLLLLLLGNLLFVGAAPTDGLARQSWRRCSIAGSRRRGAGDDAGKLANCKRVN